MWTNEGAGAGLPGAPRANGSGASAARETWRLSASRGPVGVPLRASRQSQPGRRPGPAWVLGHHEVSGHGRQCER